ncbi:unnamed protein product (macronuclear) [Paramecium tetraurelia]|uniref:Uncharacterized protein n=1 Tax=Paramecium tetraurelia TaxID=5888 RepID=A0BAN2_PARTE|nr:uncharacterized protein GSPATT00000034001 [Paramecium tetraurelia]CAK55599.1 unnamed protein product [Paramecium tetraurelia]|eukprot:XP_001422997.1 hypothetical protein (macronuclear) [Paramecium tetraurelia strain d4-2]
MQGPQLTTKTITYESDIFDVETRYILFALGPCLDLDLQYYVFNIFNQFLKQGISICEVDKPLEGRKEIFFAKLQPDIDPLLVPNIIDQILSPIKEFIINFTKDDKNLDSLYDETMILIKQLNSIKIE